MIVILNRNMTIALKREGKSLVIEMRGIFPSLLTEKLSPFTKIKHRSFCFFVSEYHAIVLKGTLLINIYLDLPQFTVTSMISSLVMLHLQ